MTAIALAVSSCHVRAAGAGWPVCRRRPSSDPPVHSSSTRHFAGPSFEKARSRQMFSWDTPISSAISLAYLEAGVGAHEGKTGVRSDGGC